MEGATTIKSFDSLPIIPIASAVTEPNELRLVSSQMRRSQIMEDQPSKLLTEVEQERMVDRSKRVKNLINQDKLRGKSYMPFYPSYQVSGTSHLTSSPKKKKTTFMSLKSNYIASTQDTRNSNLPHYRGNSVDGSFDATLTPYKHSSAAKANKLPEISPQLNSMDLRGSKASRVKPN
jgi:hypothetical protein